MKTFSQYFLYITFIVVFGILVVVSTDAYQPSTSIMAQVEPQNHAISFRKAVRIEDIYVIPGQKVKKGDPLIKVERQDLLLDVENKTRELENLISEKNILQIENQFAHKSLDSKLDLETKTIDGELERLDLIQKEQSYLSSSLLNSNIWKDSVATIDQPYIEMRRKVLLKERVYLTSQNALQSQKLDQIFALKNAEIDGKIIQVKNELELLKQEEKDLLQVAKLDGVIGNVYAEENELVSPFTTLISIYDNNPSVIRALINEHQGFELSIGQEILVKSTNRDYKVNGTIMEVGTRIVEFPNRLKTHKDVLAYGREIFISIPVESNFLHGEKVYVKLN